MTDRPSYHVSVGLIVNPNQQILINSRTADRIQAGFWEFPGGKIEPNETAEQALIRELEEEVGITPTQYKFLFSHAHQYSTHDVLIELFLVTEFTGEPKCLEEQEIAWAKIEEFENYKFLDANKDIMKRLEGSPLF